MFYVWLGNENLCSVVELMCLFKSELSLSVSLTPPFSFFFFFQVPIYLNSFPLFFFLLHWFPNPSLCMQLGPSCVSVTVYMCAYMYVYVFVWVFLAQCCHSEHSTLYTKDSSSKKREGERERERTGGKHWNEKDRCACTVQSDGAMSLDQTYFNGRCITAWGWGVGSARQQWRAQAPQFITRTLQGTQLRRQKQRVGGTEEEEKRGGWQRWGTDGVDRAGDSKNISSAWEDKKWRGLAGRDRRDRTDDRLWDNLSVSSFVFQCSHSSKCRRFLPF